VECADSHTVVKHICLTPYLCVCRFRVGESNGIQRYSGRLRTSVLHITLRLKSDCGQIPQRQVNLVLESLESFNNFLCNPDNPLVMNRILSRILPVVLICLCVEAFAQQEFRTTSATTIGYLEYLPRGYKNDTKAYPVLIFLHGIGERGPNTANKNALERASHKVLKHGPPKHIRAGTDFPFIVISPQLKARYKTWPVWYVMEVIEHVKRTLRIDENRIYLTGLSMGGGGTWTVAQDYPSLFAAIAPVCGGYNSPPKADGIANAHVAVWAFHGDRDPIVPLSRSQRMVDAINSHHANPKAILTIYQGVRHEAWDNAYQPGHGVHSPNMYEWLMAQSRNRKPEPANSAPVVSAGNDISLLVTQSSVRIEGKASDKDGKIVRYRWTKTGGGDVKLEGADSPTLLISGYKTGRYSFMLTATDDKNGEAQDQVIVDILPEPAQPVLTVSAGPDLTTNRSYVTITGKAEIKNAKIVSYDWKQTKGSEVTLEGRNNPALTVKGLKRGKYAFAFSVKDDHANIKSDEVELIVRAKKRSPRLYANAGNDVKVTFPVKTVQLHGKASSSIGKKVISHKWVQVAGKRVKIHRANTLTPVLSDFRSPGSRSFKLIVRDEDGYVRVDHVKVFVTEPRARTKFIEKDSITVVDERSQIFGKQKTPSFDLSAAEWDAKYKVIVFDDRGQKLFAGQWGDDVYRSIFTNHGFYIYQVWEGPKRIYTGKVIVK
jgi:poly(3-hydroxybutyrate) depolymerase